MQQETSLPRWHLWFAALLPILFLVPFLNKAVHIDDTVYIYVARWIQHHPIDFYSFPITWDNQPMWVFLFNRNPPLLPFYLGTLAFLVGWSEVALHALQLIPTALTSVGILVLANRLCRHPVMALCAAVLTPAFLVSGSTIMCEPLMLMFYVWAIVLWIRGLDTESQATLIASSVCIALGMLSKYVVITAIPLLLAYTLCRDRAFSRKLYILLIPCGVFAMYELFGIFKYSTSFFRGPIVAGSGDPLTLRTLFSEAVNGLSFTGAIFISALLLIPMLHRAKMLLALLGVFGLTLIAVILPEDAVWSYWVHRDDAIRWGLVVQLSLFITGGLHILLLAGLDAYRERNEDSLLLVLWVVGIFAFGSFLNWTTSSRSLLPMAPAVAILAIRQFERMEWSATSLKFASLPLAASAAIATAVCIGDYAYAASTRTAVEQIYSEADQSKGRTWFQGHWGFQYYMEQRNATHINWTFLSNEPVPMPEEGDRIVWWVAQYSVFPFELFAEDKKLVEIEQLWLVSTMNLSNGSGFYWSAMGPVPYYFGSSSPEQFWVYDLGPNPWRAYQRPAED